jgi:hypothetical protein
MRKEFLNRYWVVVRCYDDKLRNLAEACEMTSKRDGQDAVSVTPKMSPADAKAQLSRADIVVALCQTVTPQVRDECSESARSGSVVLLCQVGKHSAELRQMEATIQQGIPGARVWGIPRADEVSFLASFLPHLNRAVRLLDSKEAEPGGHPFVKRFVRRISRWQILERRLNKAADLKRAAGAFFLDKYLAVLPRAGIFRLFFESGSSIAFLSEQFLSRLGDAWVQNATQLWHVETNNLLCLMELIEAKGVRLHLYPDGPPETTYAATFGRLATIPPETGPKLSSKARELVDEVRRDLSNYKETGIIFGTTSGIDLSKHPGPHVGSFQNMLLKRALLESEAPLVFFLDQYKLPYDFISGHCYAVCDEDFTWSHVCKNVPLALACAFDDEAKGKKVLKKLDALGFTNAERSRDDESPWSVIVSNDPFKRRWE